ncbi:tRNA (adenine(22)-N(1))-methyltransferase [Thermoflavimicrobium daqui]|uniref:tRNA (Adenine(22)-N(1))-methyltransferase TrmK n=1 Tax=Thermoflavimicrobium daqui TaxID=2137476 RepID=A0A364K6H9_9BACL|nr:class I SAM-dependent methyltransferase [Thermoflavimicrobium daqui]RAL25887.1 tRNA (adenine(22)-N(1))-methyltransferase TrmK [Thermoflavimicrobium daqui]
MKFDISKRLQKIASYIPDYAKVADIGADHAFLLLSVAMEGRLKQGIVGELNKGPFENARQQIEQQGYASLIDTRLGDGLAIIHPEEVDVIVIAGMGGSLIVQILETGKEKLSHVKRLILQPNIGGHRVRQWLHHHRWQLVDETIVEEAQILYEILVAEQDITSDAYLDDQFGVEELMIIGPILWKKRHPLLRKKAAQELMSKKRILEQLEEGKTEQAQQKRAKVLQELRIWERMMTCLLEDMN